MNRFQVRKVAVLGAGVMGSGIAAHVANAGIPVVLLDIVPNGANDRSALARGAIDAPVAEVRAYAVEQLNRIEAQGAYVSLAADDLAAEAVDPRAERQATEYVAGVTRWRRWLDFLVAASYRGDAEQMDLVLRQVLRVALYDLLFLRTPPHAALHEAVELAKHAVHRGAGGLVNGILRNLLRRLNDLPEPDRSDAAEYLAIRHSHPTWMVRRWLDRLGPDETEALLRWNNARPVYGLRAVRMPVDAMRKELDALEVGWEASAFLPTFVRVQTLQPVIRAGWLADGRVAVLPFDVYRRFPWNGERAVLDPAGGTQQTVARLSLSVGLPHHFKGTHMSRFVEVLWRLRPVIEGAPDDRVGGHGAGG